MQAVTKSVKKARKSIGGGRRVARLNRSYKRMANRLARHRAKAELFDGKPRRTTGLFTGWDLW